MLKPPTKPRVPVLTVKEPSKFYNIENIIGSDLVGRYTIEEFVEKLKSNNITSFDIKDYDEDSYAVNICTSILEENPCYENEMADYKQALEKYEKAKVKYEQEMKIYNKELEIYNRIMKEVNESSTEK
jgi:hypothetical protein